MPSGPTSTVLGKVRRTRVWLLSLTCDHPVEWESGLRATRSDGIHTCPASPRSGASLLSRAGAAFSPSAARQTPPPPQSREELLFAWPVCCSAWFGLIHGF